MFLFLLDQVFTSYSQLLRYREAKLRLDLVLLQLILKGIFFIIIIIGLQGLNAPNKLV